GPQRRRGARAQGQVSPTYGRTGRDQNVLVGVIGPDLDGVEPRDAEGTGERARAPVRAVLVIDIPECAQVQDPGDLGDHEEHHGLGPIAHGTAEAAQEVGHGVYVLERHLAADEVGLEIAVRLGVQVLDEGHPATRARLADHLVEAPALVAAHLGEHGDELALTAPELDHPLAAQTEALDQVAREPLVEGVEGRRYRLGRLVVVLVAHARRVEGAVPDEAAARAEAQADVALRAVQRVRARTHQRDLMHRHVVHRVERTRPVTAAGGAGVNGGAASAPGPRPAGRSTRNGVTRCAVAGSG